MAKHRTHSIAFKRQIVQEYLGGEMMHGLALEKALRPQSIDEVLHI